LRENDPGSAGVLLVATYLSPRRPGNSPDASLSSQGEGGKNKKVTTCGGGWGWWWRDSGWYIFLVRKLKIMLFLHQPMHVSAVAVHRCGLSFGANVIIPESTRKRYHNELEMRSSKT